MASSDIIWLNGAVLGQLLEDVDASIVFDDYGIASASLSYQCMYEGSVQLVQGLYTHPDFPWLIRKNATIQRQEAGMAVVKINFEGVSDNTGQNGGGIPDPVYSIQGSLSSEPIETHIKFKDIAGNWKDENTWVNGASFDKVTGRFLGFAGTVNGEPNPKGGVRSYLDPSIVFNETQVFSKDFINATAVNMNDLGNINAPPQNPYLPEVNGKRNWLLVSCTVDQVGLGIKITRSWRLSGRNGWDADIYTDEEA